MLASACEFVVTRLTPCTFRGLSTTGPALTPASFLRHFALFFASSRVPPAFRRFIPFCLPTCLSLGHRAFMDSEVNTGRQFPGEKRKAYE
jgi:hypothetical protein